MLSEKEKDFARELLERIELEDLITLTDTVTNRAVTAENRKEATDAILLYSVNAAQLLRRKKVRREHLYHYLSGKGSLEPVSADKPYLCRKILRLWGSNDQFEKDDDEEDDNTPLVYYPAQSEQPAFDQAKNIPTATGTNKQDTVSTIDAQSLAENFTQWFYKIWNSLIDGNNADNQWGHHHFWNDAKCTIAMLSEQQVQDECQGAEGVSIKLAEVVFKEKLFFNLNAPSVKGEINNYGLVRILAGGTLHRFNNCIGIFEQTFGLIRDPHSENNWKIKFTQLRLKAQGHLQGQETPSLCAATNNGQLTLTK